MIHWLYAIYFITPLDMMGCNAYTYYANNAKVMTLQNWITHLIMWQILITPNVQLDYFTICIRQQKITL